jgi:hypothetical protein
VFPSQIAPNEPTAGVAISAANATGVAKKKVKANTQKQRLESSVVARACFPVAPSARSGSERLAEATNAAVTTPAQKSAGVRKIPPHPRSDS